jgi:hypothetical protein
MQPTSSRLCVHLWTLDLLFARRVSRSFSPKRRAHLVPLRPFVYSLSDTIKTRAQTAPKGQFNGPWHVATSTVKNEGFRALYKGQSPYPLPSCRLCSLVD